MRTRAWSSTLVLALIPTTVLSTYPVTETTASKGFNMDSTKLAGVIRALFSGMAVGLIAPTTAALFFGLTIVAIGIIIAHLLDKD